MVAELVLSYGYHGRAWTVGCNSEAAARRAFERRVAANRAAGEGPGAVIAYERTRLRPICWTEEILDAKGVIDYWFRE